MVLYLETLLKLVNILKNLISAVREGNWKVHFQAIHDMTSFFLSNRHCKLSTILPSLSLMRQLPEEHPSIYKEFMEGKVCSKNICRFLQCCCTYHETAAKHSMVQEGWRCYHWSNRTLLTLNGNQHTTKFLTSVKATVTSEDQFWQRQMQQH